MSTGVLIALGVAGLIIVWCIGLARVIRLAFRFIVGRPMDGRPRTNATWLRRADRVLHPSGRASHWAHLPGWERAALRMVVLGVLALAGLAYLTEDGSARLVLVGIGATAVLWALWRTVRIALDYRHQHRYVRPLATALGPVLGIPPKTTPASWLTVPRGFGRGDGREIRVLLPATFTGGKDTEKTVVNVVRDKLGITELDATFSHVGRPVATFRPVPRPPKRVTFDHVRELIEAAPESAPLIGLGHRDQPVSVDLDSESPHILISASTGGGKSFTARTILAQILHNGGLALVLDIKQISHAWCGRGMPNVRYERDIEDIHNALVALRGELDRRNALVNAGADEYGNVDHIHLGPRLVVLLEEINATAQRLAAYWRKIKTKDEPNVSPAVEALADVLYMGRAVRVHVIALGQLLTARALGGPELRECFGTRILARYTVNAWRMLLPEVWPMPRSSRHPGRVQVGLAGQARETQVVLVTPQEARDYALSGALAEWGVPASHVSLAAPHQQQQPGTVPGLHLVTEDDGSAVGLGEAVDAGVVSVSVESLRAARKRDAEFPPPIGKRGAELLYDADQLRRWERNRPRAGRAVGDDL